jgi:hypothetical protein
MLEIGNWEVMGMGRLLVESWYWVVYRGRGQQSRRKIERPEAVSLKNFEMF